MSIITAFVLFYFACKIGGIITDINSGERPTPDQIRRTKAELEALGLYKS